MSADGREFVIHKEPVWRDRADFIINAALPESDRPKQYEQLWVRKLGGDEFELCCIPFFLYDVALGDVVHTRPREGRRYVLHWVTKPSGRYVFRVWFGDSFYPRHEAADELVRIGALLEWSSRNLLAVDAEDAARAQEIANYLDSQENRGTLNFETGRSS